jgi:NAD(P)-dependent dehydrogenase (short-subunit alcohol dehydrogenase family)
VNAFLPDPAVLDYSAAEGAGTATGRFTHPQEVADVVLLLAGDRSGNTTGTDVVIDGDLAPML